MSGDMKERGGRLIKYRQIMIRSIHLFNLMVKI